MQAELEKLLNELRMGHYYCDDPWFTCPKNESGCANEGEGEDCNCGADTHNAKVEDLRALLSRFTLCQKVPYLYTNGSGTTIYNPDDAQLPTPLYAPVSIAGNADIRRMVRCAGAKEGGE